MNVWVPPGGGRKPVMVWFHGGGFVGGSGSSPTYDGQALSRRGVIVVSVNYRLGVLGFLSHPELSGERARGLSGNYGLMDQVAALSWVNRNIGRFGGEPGNVTIFGQSAGAISVADLITIPDARRYFRRAILESGTPFGVGHLPDAADVQRASADFGHIADLRRIEAKELIARWTRFSAAAPLTRRAIPVVDGVVLRRQPSTEYLEGAAQDVPLLVGSNLREIPASSRQEVVQAATPLLGEGTMSILAAYEREGPDPAAGAPFTQMMTDVLFRCGAIETAALARRSWLYHFRENFPGRDAPAHSAEVFYVFGTPSAASGGGGRFSARQDRLSGTMQDYWTNFAKRGDPNGAGLPRWDRFTGATQNYVELSADGVSPARSLREAKCGPMRAIFGQSRRSGSTDVAQRTADGL